MIMTRKRAYLLMVATGLGWTTAAHAQPVPVIVFYLAASPLVLLVLSILLGVVTRHWKWTLRSLALGAFWILWFLLASYFIESDALNWAPIIGMWAQSVVLLVWLLWGLISRLWALRGDA
jgi:hypothetical protein